jgi:hypothetical protein
VAPVRVGSGAYVAAGSAITENVPRDALALGRSRQVNKPGWARTRRQKLAAQAAEAVPESNQPPHPKAPHTEWSALASAQSCPALHPTLLAVSPPLGLPSSWDYYPLPLRTSFGVRNRLNLLIIKQLYTLHM